LRRAIFSDGEVGIGTRFSHECASQQFAAGKLSHRVQPRRIR
jgi:hypothetical protein